MGLRGDWGNLRRLGARERESREGTKVVRSAVPAVLSSSPNQIFAEIESVSGYRLGTERGPGRGNQLTRCSRRNFFFRPRQFPPSLVCTTFCSSQLRHEGVPFPVEPPQPPVPTDRSLPYPRRSVLFSTVSNLESEVREVERARDRVGCRGI